MRKIILFLTFSLGAIPLYAQGCVADLSLTTSETVTPVLHQASNTVVASSNYGVSSGYDSTLRAGVLVELKSDVHIKSGSLFLAYIGPCAKSREAQQDKFTDELGMIAYPNPVESILNLSLDSTEMSKVTVTTLDGRTVHTQDAKNATSLQLELGSYPSGIYVLTVETTDGQVFREKIIKK